MDAAFGQDRATKIVFLVPAYSLESVSFIAYQYVTALRRQGWDAVICALRRSSPPACATLRAPLWRMLSCDVLVTNLFLPDVAGFLLSRIVPGVQWVPFLHCDIVGGLAAERRPFARLKIRVWRAVLSRARLVISPSQYALRSLPGVSRVEIIPHCIVPDLEAAFRAQAATDGESPVAAPAPVRADNSPGAGSYVFIGRDTRGKRLRSLLNLLMTDPDVTVKVIGAIDHSRSFLDNLTPPQAARCLVLGHRRDPYDHVQPGDIVVCPSGREGFGLVPIECIARGIPVAVINEGVFRELYGGTSIVYENVVDLRRSLGSLGEDANRIRARFIGEAALAQRVDRLAAVLLGTRIADICKGS